MPVCHDSQSPTGDLGRKMGRGTAGEIHSGSLHLALVKAWGQGPHSLMHVHTPAHTHTHPLPRHVHRSRYYPETLSHTFWLSREPNKNTNLIPCSLQVDDFKSMSETVMWTAHSEYILKLFFLIKISWQLYKNISRLPFTVQQNFKGNDFFNCILRLSTLIKAGSAVQCDPRLFNLYIS